jgi:hypothetical protein
VPEEASVGTYLVTLRGEGGGLSRTVTFRLTVAEPDKGAQPLLLLVATIICAMLLIVVTIKLRRRK